MKLTKYPRGLFYEGHSGARFGAADMPRLRAMREVYRDLLGWARAMHACEKEPAMLVAGATVVADLEAKYDACGSVLARLESTPAGWRP